MSTTAVPDRFTTLPDEAVLLQRHHSCLQRVVTEDGIADAINDADSRLESARNKMFALDFVTQVREMKAIGGQPDYALGSVHAVTRDGTLVIASAASTSSSSASTSASNRRASRIRPPPPRDGPMIRDAAPDDRQLALAPLDENVDHVRGSPAGRLTIDGVVHRGGYDPPTLLAG